MTQKTEDHKTKSNLDLCPDLRAKTKTKKNY